MHTSIWICSGIAHKRAHSGAGVRQRKLGLRRGVRKSTRWGTHHSSFTQSTLEEACIYDRVSEAQQHTTQKPTPRAVQNGNKDNSICSVRLHNPMHDNRVQACSILRLHGHIYVHKRPTKRIYAGRCAEANQILLNCDMSGGIKLFYTAATNCSFLG